jgi:3-phosphoshikimate 1-carboxyvinyltransferase
VFNQVNSSADACAVVPLAKGRSREYGIELPTCPDKSLTHRAVIFASMAKGRSVIVSPLDSDDCLATRRAFVQLGVSFSEEKNEKQKLVWVVDSPGIQAWHSPTDDIDLGNSGTSARLLTGLFSGIPGLRVRITGDHSLQKRPMARVIEPLRAMGAEIEAAVGGFDGATLPLTITGASLISRYHNLKTPSAQIKSALLLAGTTCRGQTVVKQPGGSRDHTENLLDALGACVRRSNYLGSETTEIVGPWMPRAFHCEIPSDPSSVSFFAAMAALHPGLKVTARRVLTNQARTGFFTALERMGVKVSVIPDEEKSENLGEGTGTWSFYRAPGHELKPITISAEDIPALIDEVPILSVVAAFAEGVSTIGGLAELRVKESDRLDMTAKLLDLAGITCKITDECLQVTGSTGARAFSFGSDDHRLVMAAMVLATRGDKSSNIKGLQWIRTSFPLFVHVFQNIYSVMTHD